MQKTLQIQNICCIGAGYVGGPTMSVIAKNCPEIKITVVDINKQRINSWNDNNLDNLPIYEPGLKNIIKECVIDHILDVMKVEDKIKLINYILMKMLI